MEIYLSESFVYFLMAGGLVFYPVLAVVLGYMIGTYLAKKSN